MCFTTLSGIDMSTNPRKLMLQKLAEDAQWKRYKRIVENAREPEFDKYLDEIRNMHKSRPVRILGLGSTTPSGKKLAKAAMVDQAYRSRCVELVVNVVVHRDALEQAISIIKKHIEGSYSDYMKSLGLRGITERRTLVNSLVSIASDLLSEMETLVRIGDIIIQDVDRASYALKHAVDSIQVALKREKSF